MAGWLLYLRKTMARTCTVCGKRAYSDYCVQHKPRNPIKSLKKPLQHIPLPSPRKRIKQKAKQGLLWDATRDRWFKEHQAPYICHYCGKFLPRKQTTLDHKIPRSRAPELRHDFDNLVPCCYSCNSLKGSVEHDKYMHTCH